MCEGVPYAFDFDLSPSMRSGMMAKKSWREGPVPLADRFGPPPARYDPSQRPTSGGRF